MSSAMYRMEQRIKRLEDSSNINAMALRLLAGQLGYEISIKQDSGAVVDALGRVTTTVEVLKVEEPESTEPCPEDEDDNDIDPSVEDGPY